MWAEKIFDRYLTYRLMAEKLRWETLAATLTGNANNLTNFENTAAKTMFIRDLYLMGSFNGLDAGDSDELELSKSATGASNADGDSTFRVQVAVRAVEQLSTAVDGGIVDETDRKYAKGQVTLEPGETLFMNQLGGSASGQGKAIIGYHY